jgi:hypothetical protein
MVSTQQTESGPPLFSGSLAVSRSDEPSLMGERDDHIRVAIWTKSQRMDMLLTESRILVCRRTPNQARSRRPGHFVPKPESVVAELSVIRGGEQMASRAEMRSNDFVNLDEPLSVPSGFKPPHPPFPLAGWLMRVLSPRCFFWPENIDEHTGTNLEPRELCESRDDSKMYSSSSSSTEAECSTRL